jgi:hypothetical protein
MWLIFVACCLAPVLFEILIALFGAFFTLLGALLELAGAVAEGIFGEVLTGVFYGLGMIPLRRWAIPCLSIGILALIVLLAYLTQPK